MLADFLITPSQLLNLGLLFRAAFLRRRTTVILPFRRTFFLGFRAPFTGGYPTLPSGPIILFPGPALFTDGYLDSTVPGSLRPRCGWRGITGRHCPGGRRA